MLRAAADNEVGPKGAAAFFEALTKHNSQLTTLDLAGNSSSRGALGVPAYAGWRKTELNSSLMLQVRRLQGS